MTALTPTLKLFSSLNRAPGATWTDATKRKAPHKPLLLLAVLDLIHRGVITSPFIAVSGDLVELNELFNLYWRRIIPLGQTSSIAFPFSRLDREQFWELVPLPGMTITPAIINNTASVTYLRKYALGAKLDDGLFRVMQSGEGGRRYGKHCCSPASRSRRRCCCGNSRSSTARPSTTAGCWLKNHTCRWSWRSWRRTTTALRPVTRGFAASW